MSWKVTSDKEENFKILSSFKNLDCMFAGCYYSQFFQIILLHVLNVVPDVTEESRNI